MKQQRTDVLGVGFNDLTMEQAVDCAMEQMQRHAAARVVTPNPEIVMLCRKNPAAAAAVNSAELVLPDGVGVLYGARILGRPIANRLPGIDFASALMARMAQQHMRVFLLGAKPGVAEAAAARLEAQYPGLVIAGVNDGYFKEDAPVIGKINAARPDFLMVCLGAPKQELWMQQYAAQLDVGLMAGLGGAMDVFAGNVRRAPAFWRKAGLEWFYRLCSDPRRIGRMMQIPKFLLVVFAERRKG